MPQRIAMSARKRMPERIRPRSNGVPRAGSDGFLSPRNPGEEFLTGMEWVSMANSIGLTTREIVVATLLLQGRTRKGIAGRLKVSPETVRVHIDRLFEKFNVQDRLGLALRIARIREMLRASPRT
jgi:DNA-binding NarL/FixJ family response regulator